MILKNKIKRVVLVPLALGMISITMGGCVYANNQSWDDMTPEEQQEVQQDFEEIKVSLEESLSGHAEDKFVQYILENVEQAMEHQE